MSQAGRTTGVAIGKTWHESLPLRRCHLHTPSLHLPLSCPTLLNPPNAGG